LITRTRQRTLDALINLSDSLQNGGAMKSNYRISFVCSLVWGWACLCQAFSQDDKPTLHSLIVGIREQSQAAMEKPELAARSFTDEQLLRFKRFSVVTDEGAGLLTDWFRLIEQRRTMLDRLLVSAVDPIHKSERTFLDYVVTCQPLFDAENQLRVDQLKIYVKRSASIKPEQVEAWSAALEKVDQRGVVGLIIVTTHSSKKKRTGSGHASSRYRKRLSAKRQFIRSTLRTLG
jgi:hypothetical protein